MSKQKEKDPRFKSVNSDPRFHTMPKKEQKVKLDDRFKAVIEQKEKFDNADEFYYVESEKETKPVKIQAPAKELPVVQEEMQVESEEDLFESDEENMVRGEQSSSRLALQNYDWNHLNAKSIYMLFHTLAEAEFSQEFNKQRVKRVEVYVSDFGEQMLNKESIEGPKDVLEKAAKKNKGRLDDKLLRKYEKDRLKYYYAIIQFDSLRSAEAVYENYDGVELELSACKIDLRFVPENLEVPKKPVDVCNGLTPKDFTKIPKFINKALGHSNVELTWDAPIQRNIEDCYDPDTGDVDHDKLNEMVAIDEEMDDMEEEGDEDNAEDIRAQLLSGTNIFDDFNKNKRKEKDIVITFKVGFGEDGDDEAEQLPKKREYREHNHKKSKKVLIKESQIKKLEKKRENKRKEELELLVDGPRSQADKPFAIDLDDERFKDFVSNPKFAVDPTNPKYSDERNKAVLERKKKISK